MHLIFFPVLVESAFSWLLLSIFKTIIGETLSVQNTSSTCTLYEMSTAYTRLH